MKTLYISISNSDDDRLTQRQWSFYAEDLLDSVLPYSSHTRGIWYSAPHTMYQNMCVCIVVPDKDMRELRAVLRGVAKRSDQDSIAMAIVDEVELVKP